MHKLYYISKRQWKEAYNRGHIKQNYDLPAVLKAKFTYKLKYRVTNHNISQDNK